MRCSSTPPLSGGSCTTDFLDQSLPALLEFSRQVDRQ